MLNYLILVNVQRLIKAERLQVVFVYGGVCCHSFELGPQFPVLRQI